MTTDDPPKTAVTPARNVLIVSFDYPPSLEPGAIACEHLVRHLPSFGWNPVVITAREKDYERRGETDTTLDDRVMRAGMLPHPLGLYRLLARFRPIRDPQTGAAGSKAASKIATPSKGFRHTLLSYLTMIDLKTGWAPPAVLRGLTEIRRQRFDYIFSSGPYWTNHLVGLALARWSGIPWCAHFRDPWTQTKPAHPTTPRSAALERYIERAIILRAQHVVCVTEAHTELLRRDYTDVPAERFSTIPNGYDESEWQTLSAPPERGNRFTITYTGDFYHRRNPATVFEALRSLIEQGEVERERIHIRLIGNCETAEGLPVRELAAKSGIQEQVELTGTIERNAALSELLAADLLLILAEGWRLQIPLKTYEYLRAGRPILAITEPGGSLCRLLEQTGGGWSIPPGNVNEICAAIKESYGAWTHGKLARQANVATVAKFDRKVLAGRFARLFDSGVV